MSYDTKCLQLALSFLDDHPDIQCTEAAVELAEEIQRTIKDWIEAKESE